MCKRIRFVAAALFVIFSAVHAGAGESSIEPATPWEALWQLDTHG